MPIAQISIIAGRTADQKQRLAEQVTAAIVDALGAAPESVRVLISEVPANQWFVGGTSIEKQRG
jgi:4-oxalocrotonate tautomerase